MRKASLIIFLLITTLTAGMCQFVVSPLVRTPAKASKKIATRTTSTASLLLPFWDDFSFSNSKFSPHDKYWQAGKSVTLNFGQAIKPPSIGVVTFNGLDGNGKPYKILPDPFVKGYTDSLVSAPINLDTVPDHLKASVFISFMFEAKGNGETPDPGDFLRLEFKNREGTWQLDTLIANDGTMRTDTFYTAIRAIDSSLFHRNFQFRFRSFGRMSGPYDNWHLDYVYVNSGRTKNDLYFPDRTFVTPMTSLFEEYFSIPKKHFIKNINGNLTTPSFDMYNVSAIALQPINFNYETEIVSYAGGVPSTTGLQLLENASPLPSIATRKFLQGIVTQKPPAAWFDPASDSFLINLKLTLKTNDNVKIPIHPGDPVGDYDTAIYSPIDFRMNDTLRAQYTISDYYAYDDGSAEYGIGLNQAGARAAYLFEMKTPDPDTIVAVDIYFPRFGDESSEIVELSILRDTLNNQSSVIHKEFINVYRTQMDTLHRYPLSTNTVGVVGNFLISWKQSTSVSIPIGWDTGTDSYNKIFFNLNGYWERNTEQHGSIMIRPVFGKGAAVISGLTEEDKKTVAYPNPNSGSFFLTGSPEQVHVTDMTGANITFTTERTEGNTRIELTGARPGLYLVSSVQNGQMHHTKVLIKP